MEDILNLEQNPDTNPEPNSESAQQTAPEPSPPAFAQRRSPVLTIESRGEASLPGAEQDALWHEITNAYMTHRILCGTLDGVERDGLAIVYYKGCRVAIPLTEMVVNLNEANARYAGQTQRIERLVNNMMGCQVDFLIRGLDAASHSIVASRRDAMLRKQRTFYLTPASDGLPQVREGRVVQARVTAVAEKSIRIEVFGVECSVLARDLAWEWICDAHDLYTVGDVILVRIQSIDLSDPSRIRVTADPRSVTENPMPERLKAVKEQSRYAGQVTDVRRGIIYLRLHNGVNAIAHNCLDRRMPAKKDQVSFVVTHINRDQNVAVGLITRIIRQVF